MDHALGSVVWILVVAAIAINAIARRLRAGSRRRTAEATAAAPPAGGGARPVTAASAPPRTAPQRKAKPAATRVESFDILRASAPPLLDSLDDAGALLPGIISRSGAVHARRAASGLSGIGTPGWGVGALIASEIFGPPVALRSRATSGSSEAF